MFTRSSINCTALIRLKYNADTHTHTNNQIFSKNIHTAAFWHAILTYVNKYAHDVVVLCVAKVVSMMTSSNGNIFRVTGPLCGEFTGPGEFPAQSPVTRIFDVFFDLRLNKRLSKQPWGWWFETPSWSLWRQCNGKVDPVGKLSWKIGSGSKSTKIKQNTANYQLCAQNIWTQPTCLCVWTILADRQKSASFINVC